MNKVHTHNRWLIAGTTVLAILGACASVLAYWATTGQADVWNWVAGSERQVWTVALLSAVLLLGVCAGRGRGILRSGTRYKSGRSASAVAHVQSTLLGRR